MMCCNEWSSWLLEGKWESIYNVGLKDLTTLKVRIYCREQTCSTAVGGVGESGSGAMVAGLTIPMCCQDVVAEGAQLNNRCVTVAPVTN